MKPSIGVLALIVTLTLGSVAHANESLEQPSISGTLLLIDWLEKDRDQAAQRPRQGMTQAEVENTFGAPETRHRPVGDPPITRWVYDDFIVYFEHHLVIRAVSRR